ncbi:cobalamin-binding protein [Allopusillimonas soli]|uniref:ABC transporter substrate-binding protein n=1 Tax=Allopusillimonas soli TaxID=659016 RepID=A0A853FA79_9BURK|nr:ABC transporter substrate-binding protein [Allopusillimonas soli]NYT37604.1 ABC transporter substrate-binding protein [Allopusillimonas soli]TEA74433.1 cobalamin-binding protein [Allopusillimonas soli]
MSMRVLLAISALLAARLALAAGGPPYERAIALAPHITELIFAAGAGKHVAGTVLRSDFPPQARSIPRVGDGLSVSAEAVLALDPDIVLAWRANNATRQLAPTLEQAHIRLDYSAPRSLDDIPAQILRMGMLFGTTAAAAPAAAALAQNIAALRQRYAQRTPVSVVIEISEPPLYVIAGDPVLEDMLRSCGATNIFSDISMPAAQASRESVLLRGPDALIVPFQDEAAVASVRRRWSEAGLPAARAGHVIGLDPDSLFRPGPRLVDTAGQLCARIDQIRQALSRRTSQAHALK